jgi:AhpC/TSA family
MFMINAKIGRQIMLALGLIAFGSTAAAAPAIGQAAPAFSLKDLNGKTVQLSDYQGKTVVLEWHNPGCPFVQKHYDSANMPNLQRKVANDVVWLAVNSTHPGHADHRDAAGYANYMKEKGADRIPYLLDSDGKTGRAYSAMTTPHMYIIDRSGQLVYAGAIDSIRSANPADVAKATNYVALALNDLKAGKPVSQASTTPYGCSVKYK